jgi:O-methyltransferase involved in polyketide biosynthesis
MYVQEADVRRLFCAVVEKFPGVELMFDTIPPWFSRKTLRGYDRTKHYRTPPMPWGVRRDDIEPLLRRWSRRVASVSADSYGIAAGGLGGLVLQLFSRTPVLRNIPPAIVRVKTTGAALP